MSSINKNAMTTCKITLWIESVIECHNYVHDNVIFSIHYDITCLCNILQIFTAVKMVFFR